MSPDIYLVYSISPYSHFPKPEVPKFSKKFVLPGSNHLPLDYRHGALAGQATPFLLPVTLAKPYYKLLYQKARQIQIGREISDLKRPFKNTSTLVRSNIEILILECFIEHRCRLQVKKHRNHYIKIEKAKKYIEQKTLKTPKSKTIQNN